MISTTGCSGAPTSGTTPDGVPVVAATTAAGCPPRLRTAPGSNARPPACNATPVIGTATSSNPAASTAPITGNPACADSTLPVSGPAAVPSDDADPTSTAHRPRASNEAASPIRYDSTTG